MKLAKVPKERAERVRRRIAALGALRRDYRIYEEGGYVLIPVEEKRLQGMDTLLDLEIVEGEPCPRPYYVPPSEQVRRMLTLPTELEKHLPQKWELLGDVLIIRIPEELYHMKGEIAQAYAKVLRARTVCHERGPISGLHRTPDLEVIWGEGTETVHKENGIFYKLDTARIMFSSGNFPEKERMSRLDCRGETVVDMFAGIGYFTLPLAKHARALKVVACEINPLAHRYLLENVRLNGLQGVVEPFLGDNRDLPGEGFAHRVVMGYLGTTHEFLPKAFSLVRAGGIIHYHETCPIDQWPHRPLRRIEEAAEGRDWEIIYKGEVKSFAPSISHYVLDIKVRG
ncbi:MAG: class I SAM-dependent methyltransferase family protein [Methanomassiliicoccales archaeon]